MPTIATANSPSAAQPRIASPAPMPPAAAPMRDAGREQGGHHDDRDERRDAAGDDPPRARHGHRQDLFETAVGLVGGPFRDERRAGEAGGDEQQLAVELQPAAGRVKSKPGKRAPKVLSDAGDARDLVGQRRRRATRRGSPISPRPMPHARARGSCSPNARAVGPRTPRTARRQAGQRQPDGDAEVAALEQLDADGQEDDAEDQRPARADGQS